MNRCELVGMLHARFKALARDHSRLAVDTTPGGIIGAIATDDRVEIRGFGSFGARCRIPQIGHKPRTGEQIQVRETRHPNFRVAKEMRERDGASSAAVLRSLFWCSQAWDGGNIGRTT
jgi:integration host factor subunit beta